MGLIFAFRARRLDWERRLRSRTSIHTIAPADVWPDAARMAVAAVAAFATSQALGLKGGFFAVLTALLTTRSSAGGMRSVVDRLVGMAIGILVGLSLVWLRHFHVSEDLLVAVAMAPLCFMVARFRKYQASPITAIVVLSAGSSVGFALHGALLRIGEVCLGAAIGFAVSLVVFRRTTDRRSRQHAADMLRGCGALMVAATTGGPAARDVALRQRIRGDLRLVMATSRVLRSRGRSLGQSHLTTLARLQSDLIFFGRAMVDLRMRWRSRARPVLERLADAFQTLCNGTADAVLTDAPAPGFASFDAALQALRLLASDPTMPRGDDANRALPFLLLRLRTDLAELLDFYAQPPDTLDGAFEADVTAEDATTEPAALLTLAPG